MLGLVTEGWRQGNAASAVADDSPTTFPLALVFGCARSGTSILGELIASHPAVAYLFEASPTWELVGHGEDDCHRLTAEHSRRPAVQDIRQWFHGQWRQAGPGKKILVEKCPRNALRVPFLRCVFPQARLIHIIRDGRDVACSLSPGIGGDEWSHLKPPNWRSLFEGFSGPVRCALAWKSVLEISLNDLIGVEHLEIRYERLVHNPEAECTRIMNFLDLPCDPAPFDFARKIQNRTDGSYLAQHQSRWYRPDHEKRIGRWRENLTLEDQSHIQEILGPMLTRLGYA